MIDIKVGIRKYRFENGDALNAAARVYDELLERYHNENFEYDIYELQEDFEECIIQMGMDELVHIYH